MGRVYHMKTNQITDGPGSDESPTWAPDGRHMIFASSRTGRWGLYMIDVSGGVPVRVSRGGANEMAPAWSPQ